MLHHRGQSNGHNGQQCAEKLRRTVDGKQSHGRLVNGEAQPGRLANGGKVHRTGAQRHRVGHQHAQQDGKNLHHALAPDVADNDGAQRHHSQQPVGLAVVDGGRGQNQTDGNDDGAGYHRGEQAHHFAHAEHADQGAEQQVQNAAEGHARTGVGQHFRIGDGLLPGSIHQLRRHNSEAAQERKGRTQECRHLSLAQEVEQQRTQTGAQQRCGNAQAGQQGHQHRSAEHGKGVLHAQNQHLGNAQDAGVINRLMAFLGFAHRRTSSFFHNSHVLPPPATAGSADGAILPYYHISPARGMQAKTAFLAKICRDVRCFSRPFSGTAKAEAKRSAFPCPDRIVFPGQCPARFTLPLPGGGVCAHFAAALHSRPAPR